MKGLRCGSIAQSLCKKGSWLNPETPQNLPQEATNQKDWKMKWINGWRGGQREELSEFQF